MQRTTAATDNITGLTELSGAALDVNEPEGAPRTTVSLVIPAKNEARNIGHVLSHLPEGIDEVILVDGRSSDATRMMARTCRPDIVIINEPAKGKGHALRAGFAAATCDVIVAMDADGSMSPEEIPHFLYFLDAGFDFVKGSRFVAGGGSLDITPIRKLGNRALLAVANHLHGIAYTDLCYGFFAFRRQYLEHLDLHSSGFEIETEINVRAHVVGLRIAEVPSLELPRRAGVSNLHAVRDGIRVLKTLINERSRPAASLPTGERRLNLVQASERTVTEAADTYESAAERSTRTTARLYNRRATDRLGEETASM